MKKINTQEAETSQQKYWAYLDARTTSAALRTTFSNPAQLIMDRAQMMLSMLHFDSATELNFRKTLAAVKVFNPNVSNPKQHREYVKHLESLGFTVKTNPRREVIYSIKKSQLEGAQ